MEIPEHHERPQWKELKKALDALGQHLPQERQEVMMRFRCEVEDFCETVDSKKIRSLSKTLEAARKLFQIFHEPITKDVLGPDLDRFDDVTEALLLHVRWFFAEQARMKEELAHIRECMTMREDMGGRMLELIALNGKRRYEGLRLPE